MDNLLDEQNAWIQPFIEEIGKRHTNTVSQQMLHSCWRLPTMGVEKSGRFQSGGDNKPDKILGEFVLLWNYPRSHQLFYIMQCAKNTDIYGIPISTKNLDCMFRAIRQRLNNFSRAFVAGALEKILECYKWKDLLVCAMRKPYFWTLVWRTKEFK